MRAFIAIKIPEEVKKGLASLQAALSKGAGRETSWTRPESIHLTLKFLGEIEESKVPLIGEAMRKASKGIGPFTVSVTGVGGFPSLKGPRVIWAGVRENPTLLQLQRNIDDNLSGLGFEKEDREFHPHLTLCRIKSFPEGKALGRLIEEKKPEIDMDFEAVNFILFRSELNPKGARYTEMVKVALEG